MADYQYTPSRHAGGDPSLDMAQAIENLDSESALTQLSRCAKSLIILPTPVDGIRKFEMPPPNEDFPESAFFPPPTFSRHPLPALFE